MKILAVVCSILASLPAWAAAAEPAPIREAVEQIAATVPAKPIRRVSIVPVDESAEGGDVLIEYADGSTHRLSTLARAEAAQLARDGQTFGFNLVAYYVDLKGDLWISTRAIVLYRQGKCGCNRDGQASKRRMGVPLGFGRDNGLGCGDEWADISESLRCRNGQKAS